MNRFIAEVRNLKDPWESGRVQIRLYGRHDDEENIKDASMQLTSHLCCNGKRLEVILYIQ